MPQVDYAEYILELAFEIGICSQSELGSSEITWSELNAWSKVMDTKLSNFECLTIKRLSRAYVEQLYASKSEFEPPPYSPQQFDREEASKRIGNVLRAMASRLNVKRKGSANVGRPE